MSDWFFQTNITQNDFSYYKQLFTNITYIVTNMYGKEFSVISNQDIYINIS